MIRTVLATKLISKSMLHSLMENGGSLKFAKHNFAIEVAGSGNMREIKLITFPESESYVGKIVVKARKPKVNLTTKEDAVEEM